MNGQSVLEQTVRFGSDAASTPATLRIKCSNDFAALSLYTTDGEEILPEASTLSLHYWPEGFDDWRIFGRADPTIEQGVLADPGLNKLLDEMKVHERSVRQEWLRMTLSTDAQPFRIEFSSTGFTSMFGNLLEANQGMSDCFTSSVPAAQERQAKRIEEQERALGSFDDVIDECATTNDGSACLQAGSLLIALEVEAGSDGENAAITFLDIACEAGEADGCALIGEVLTFDNRSDADMTAGLLGYERGCQLDHVRSCARGGHLLLRHDSSPEELARAATFGSSACEMDSQVGCLTAWSAYWKIDDSSKSLEFARKGCELDSASSCHMVGLLTASTSPKESLSNFKRGCELGHEDSCKKLK